MKTNHSILSFLALCLFSICFTACIREDIGPYQAGTASYDFTAFTKLEMGSAFRITVQQGNYNIQVKGDRRNLDDLNVRVSGGVLRAEYTNNRNRKYETEFIITMPNLDGVNFSGASKSEIFGFTNTDNFQIKLSGASRSNLNLQVNQLNIILSGASELNLTGKAQTIGADISGASILEAFGNPTTNANIEASGASYARINVSQSLIAHASGASNIRYRGNPAQVESNASGASVIQKD